ncbi:MAG TPA: hypothetical protein PLL06_04295 [Acidobacteriota bacterium]|nr:hypothetical protein [Acidobacteriota bacterium]
MVNELSKELLKSFGSQVKCYRVMAAMRNTKWKQRWLVLEDVQRNQFAVVASFCGECIESGNQFASRLEELESLDDAYNAVLSLNGLPLRNHRIWDESGANTIDGSIEKFQMSIVNSETSQPPFNDSSSPKPRIRAYATTQVLSPHHFNNEEQIISSKIKESLEQLQQMTQSESVFWKNLNPTPTGRSCQLLVAGDKQECLQ